jgi:hypothetical protein
MRDQQRGQAGEQAAISANFLRHQATVGRARSNQFQATHLQEHEYRASVETRRKKNFFMSGPS